MASSIPKGDRFDIRYDKPAGIFCWFYRFGKSTAIAHEWAGADGTSGTDLHDGRIGHRIDPQNIDMDGLLYIKFHRFHLPDRNHSDKKIR